MKRSLLTSTRGVTLIELIIIVAVMGILYGILTLSFDVAKANTRFSKIKGDMDGIAKTAYNDYTSNGVWAPITFGSMPPNWTGTGDLSQWPIPPCPGWYYSWEDWSAFGYPATQVTLRRANNTILWGFCLDTQGGSASCQVTDPIFGVGNAADITSLGTHAVYCTE